MKYSILIYGSPELREQAVPVEKVDRKIRQLAKDMLKTMYADNGIGLAAQQVGRPEAVCVIDVPKTEETDEVSGTDRSHAGDSGDDVAMPLVMINPRITAKKGKRTAQEGCLSFPGIFVQVSRAAEITVTFTDLDNKGETIKTGGLLARAVQHEMDHLEGKLLIDRMSPVQKVAVRGKLKRLKQIGVD